MAIFETIKKSLNFITDFILPPRDDFAIVKKLDEKAFNSLPKAPPLPNMDWISALFHYKDNRVRAIIWKLKYKENTLPLEHIGQLLYEEIIALISDISLFNAEAEFILIPIPISLERRSERGYNQSEHIAKAILDYDHDRTLTYAPQWLNKIKETAIQSRSVSREERMRNLVGCFEANPLVEGKYVILIDDVVTTGSTLSEARNTLLSAGVRDVFAFTIAH